jgi:diguanylate cyclase (GGDEF)-like protein
VAVQVLESVRDPNCQIPQLARLISKDPALASKILRTVNSSIYACPKKISRLSQALSLLGLQTVRVLALGFSLAHNLKTYKSKGFRALDYWRRSVYGATAALTLAQRMHVEMLEEAFIAGLLMDVGVLALHQMFPGEYDTICDRARTHSDLVKLEESLFASNHAQVGGVLAEKWGLPDTLWVPIAQHHNPADVQDPALRKLAEICQIAGRCADVFVEQSAAGAVNELREYCHVHLDFDEVQSDGLLQQISRRTGEIAPLFDVHVNTDVSVEEILQQANHSVVQFTLESQRQPHRPSPPVAVASDRSPHLLLRPEFETALQTALKDGGPHALLLISIDRFTDVEREHGRKIADSVIAHIPTLLSDLTLPPNSCAQFLEDQFAVLVPHNDRRSALTRAESLRRKIFETPLDFGRLTIPLTVSIGVAATDAGAPFRTAPQFLKAAELALDAARHSGANRVRAFSLSQPTAA